MLFRKKIERACSYCARGTSLEGDKILCCKKGLREPWDKCRKFRYDPSKRIPAKPKAMDFTKYSEDDFSL